MALRAEGATNPDLTEGVTLADFGDGQVLRGHVGKKGVMLVRNGDEILAVSSRCTHYGGPLEKGLIADGEVRCPWHHARFSLHTGEAVAAPAFGALSCWRVEREGERIIVREAITPAPRPEHLAAAGQPGRIVIIGGGAAGFSAAELLRRRGYAGTLTILSEDADAPCDRPNLSKDFLAGKATEKWLPLESADFYASNNIDLRLATKVTAVDATAQTVTIEGGETLPYDRLLLATGAEPIHLDIPGADLPHVLTLRSLADSRALIARAEGAKTAVVLGSGFIGLEVAGSLTERGITVHVVSLDERPLERVLGADLGDYIRELHEDKGETFHMGTSISEIREGEVTLANGTTLPADLVVMGVGVRPRVALAEAAGLAIDRGVVVNERLETSRPNIYAAGDIARWPGSADGETMRVEHWVVAERQGQVAAENMLGAKKTYRDTPFFWSRHHGVSIRYAGHAEGWDEVRIDGEVEDGDCLVSYRRGGRTIAVAGIGRDMEILAEAKALARAD